MNNLRKYTARFFDELEVFEDVSRGHAYKSYIRQAVMDFLDSETKETAFAVYRTFFDSYRITLPGSSNPFVDLLDVLRSYEENAATLIDKQRDHYVHSVNVFILGLCIYVQNRNYRAAFDEVNLDKRNYPYSYDTRHEEFFYRWGLASLFHDVGYPVEIIGKQIGKFIAFAAEADGGAKVRSHLEFDNFDALNSIAEVLPKREFTRAYCEKYDSCVYVDLLKPTDLLAQKLYLSLGVDVKTVKAALDGFVGTMARSGFIDHGYYSALIVLKWYGFLIQSCGYRPEYFFYPVLDSASAILLHNYYKNVIMKPPFGRGRLSPKEHPVAYLLILCDELQEWNREAYGIADKKRTHAAEASLAITDRRLEVTYLAKKSTLPEAFSAEKERLFCELLDMDAVFDGGFAVGCEVLDRLTGLAGGIRQNAAAAPRPLLDNLEKLAIAIHELFNQKQLERYPDAPLSYPRFADLPDTLKYSNLRQAMSMADKLDRMGWEMRPEGGAGEAIEEIPEADVETLSVFEHDAWVQERLGTGWTYGAVKDIENKISPYILPYEELPEEIKELDRDTIRNIPELLERIGMRIYRRGAAPALAPADAGWEDGPYIYVCYDHSDAEVVLSHIESLRGAGFRVWHDAEAAPGADWPDVTARALEGAACVLAVLSPKAAASGAVKSEITFSLAQKKAVVCVFVRETQLPPGLRMQLDNVTTLPEYRFESKAKFYERLKKALPACTRDEGAERAGREAEQ